MPAPRAVIRVRISWLLQHLIETGLFHIQDFSLQGQNGLKASIPGLFGGTAGRIALHQIEFPPGRVPFLTVGQFAGERQIAQAPFLRANSLARRAASRARAASTTLAKICLATAGFSPK